MPASSQTRLGAVALGPDNCMQPTSTPPGSRPTGWDTAGVAEADAICTASLRSPL